MLCLLIRMRFALVATGVILVPVTTWTSPCIAWGPARETVASSLKFRLMYKSDQPPHKVCRESRLEIDLFCYRGFMSLQLRDSLALPAPKGL